ncbi:MAG TPA: phosphoribosyltransferase family protein [Propionibacteriaceae bacterium]|jgi:predicted phosphoribosyltransferase|nr:phosphoribosyltransferase family protein [Propionibacteriaceae bacterium]
MRRRRAANRYANRTVAGRALADALVAEAVLEKPVVLALPRGGVPIGAEVAARLDAQLGVILVRKIGVPGRSELAMGALALVGGDIAEFRNEEIINGLRISNQAFEAARNRELLELKRRASIFPSADLDIADATVVLVDDGLATGSTMLAAVAAVRTKAPAAVVVAVPVGARQAVQALRSVADRVVCLWTPEPFVAVGGAYEDFRQLSDEEVLSILKEYSS